jgi:hypothetical protein
MRQVGIVDPGERMVSDRDIWSMAKMLVDQHGADAAIQAAMRADQKLELGDADSQAVWKRILRAVEELLHLPDPVPSEWGDAVLRSIAERLTEMFDVDARRYALDRARLKTLCKYETAVVWRAIAVVVDDLRQGRNGDTVH